MPKYVIEREIPGAGDMSADERRAVAQKSNGVLHTLGPGISWDHSYVTADKIYCVYNSDSEDKIREHAAQGGFPADIINKIVAVIDPSTAE